MQVKVILVFMKQQKQLQRKARKKILMLHRCDVLPTELWSLVARWKQVRCEFNLYWLYEESDIVFIFKKEIYPSYKYKSINRE